MSYSFYYQSANKAEAKAALSDKFDEVVASQPTHARDKDAAIANACAAIDILTDTVPDGHVLYVSMNGSLGWSEKGGPEFISASINCHANYGLPR